MMNEEPNQVVNAEALAIVPAKRKRGRPRKYPMLDDPNSFLGNQSPSNGGDGFHVPACYRGSSGSKSRRVDPSGGLRVGMTGQAVSGFLEGEFDGGYLLTVRVRNSDTILRGVVFKPGCVAPVSVQNDVAPNLHMIKRIDMPFGKENYGRADGGTSSRSRERNGVAYPSGLPSASLVALKCKLMSPAPFHTASSVPVRGNVVPVVLQPVTSTNNGAFSQNQRASVGNRDSHNLSPALSQETQPVALQVIHPAAQSAPSEQQAPKTSENGSRGEPSDEASYELETKPVIAPPPGMSFENLVTEVIKRTRIPSQADNAVNSSAVGKPSTALEDGVGKGEQLPVFIEPFQAVQCNLMNLSHSIPNSLESERTGKMTELLQAVQENAMKSQMPEHQ